MKFRVACLLTCQRPYKLQERPLGGLSKSILRKLECQNIGSEDTKKPLPPITLKPGTRLVREWRGVTHTVLVHADGFEWNGRCYRSLTIIAYEITGANWSGPRFFGLRSRSVEGADEEECAALLTESIEDEDAQT